MSAGERRGLDAKRNNKKEKERPRPAPAPPEAAAAAALSPERCGAFVSFSVSWVSPDRRPAALAPFPLDLLSLLRPPFCLMRGSFDGRSWPSFSTLLPLCGALCALLRSRRYLESRLLIGLLIGLLIDAAHNFWPLTCDW